MNRIVWFAAGAGAGIYAMVRGRRAAQAFTTDGLRDRWQALGVGARILRDEVAQGRAEKESELRERLLAAYDSTPQIAGGSATRVTDVDDDFDEDIDEDIDEEGSST